MFLELFILTAVILSIGLLAMAIRIFVKGRFTQTVIGKNKEMAKRGVYCASHEERKLRNKIDKKPVCTKGGC
ncbi:MAG: hypothetical protein U9R54_09465 [Bacteroidota bacterium]|nr:hypothetical protein [Bacteroidota bacterium]